MKFTSQPYAYWFCSQLLHSPNRCKACRHDASSTFTSLTSQGAQLKEEKAKLDDDLDKATGELDGLESGASRHDRSSHTLLY